MGHFSFLENPSNASITGMSPSPFLNTRVKSYLITTVRRLAALKVIFTFACICMHLRRTRIFQVDNRIPSAHLYEHTLIPESRL